MVCEQNGQNNTLVSHAYKVINLWCSHTVGCIKERFKRLTIIHLYFHEYVYLLFAHA